MSKKYYTDAISEKTLIKLIDKTLNYEKTSKNRSIKKNLLKIIPAIAAYALVIGFLNILPNIQNGNTQVLPGDKTDAYSAAAMPDYDEVSAVIDYSPNDEAYYPDVWINPDIWLNPDKIGRAHV